MSIDANFLLDCPPLDVVKAMVRAGHSRDSAIDYVEPVGTQACTVGTPSPYPGASRESWTELVGFIRKIVKAGVSHDDDRGILVFPDEVIVRSKSYAGAVRAIGSDGEWLTLEARSYSHVRAKGTPQHAGAQKAPKLKPAPATLSPGGPSWACVLFPPPIALRGTHHPAVAALTELPDGAALVVVKELFSDVDALLRFFVEAYPQLLRGATDPRGLFVLPRKSFAKAAAAGSYKEVITKLGRKAVRVELDPPKHEAPAWWLSFEDLPVLREALTARRDTQYLRGWGIRD